MDRRINLWEGGPSFRTNRNGPVECAIVDEMVASGKLRAWAVHRALGDLDLVAVRIQTPRGLRVSYVTRGTAIGLGAAVPPQVVEDWDPPRPWY